MKKDGKDVGFIEDAILYLQNAIAGENHAIMSYLATKSLKWLQISSLLRRNRSKILYKLTNEEKGEGYCFGKHILACSCALKELGNRCLEDGNQKEADEYFSEAGDYEALFKLVNSTKFKEKENVWKNTR